MTAAEFVQAATIIAGAPPVTALETPLVHGHPGVIPPLNAYLRGYLAEPGKPHPDPWPSIGILTSTTEYAFSLPHDAQNAIEHLDGLIGLAVGAWAARAYAFTVNIYLLDERTGARTEGVRMHYGNATRQGAVVAEVVRGEGGRDALGPWHPCDDYRDADGRPLMRAERAMWARTN